MSYITGIKGAILVKPQSFYVAVEAGQEGGLPVLGWGSTTSYNPVRRYTDTWKHVAYVTDWTIKQKKEISSMAMITDDLSPTDLEHMNNVIKPEDHLESDYHAYYVESIIGGVPQYDTNTPISNIAAPDYIIDTVTWGGSISALIDIRNDTDNGQLRMHQVMACRNTNFSYMLSRFYMNKVTLRGNPVRYYEGEIIPTTMEVSSDADGLIELEIDFEGVGDLKLVQLDAGGAVVAPKNVIGFDTIQ